jgi:tryptophan synthase alpha chain
MNRLEKLFESKTENILNIYCTAGFPEMESTIPVMKALEKHGADIIELGMPYSDPLADGPVIQASSAKAIANGMHMRKLFDDLRGMREQVTVPVVLMGYLNPVMQYGFEKFCEQAADCGIDGLIIPDIPVYEYEKHYQETVETHGLNFIFLITPDTSEERIRKLDELSSGFLYAVSSSSITGSGKEITGLDDYLLRLKNMELKNPVLVGFGIKNFSDFKKACRYANGAIVGSAYISALEKNNNIEETTAGFLKEFKQ